MQGTQWANQYKAPAWAGRGETMGGMPLLPANGGYGKVPQLPFLRAPQPEIKPAGYGPIGLGLDGIDLNFFLAKPALTGRNEFGNPWAQGERYRVIGDAPQGLWGSAKFMKGR